MNKIILLISLIITGCTEPPSLPKLSSNSVILAFGDSLTYGSGSTQDQNYPNILSNLIHLTVVNEGVPGEISQKGVSRLPQLLDNYRPDLLILMHGGNDMLRKIKRKETAENISNMIKEAQKRNIAVFLLGVPEPTLFFLNSAQLYQTIADQFQIPAELELMPDILSDRNLKSDPIHPNNAGYKKMAERIFKRLQEAGALS